MEVGALIARYIEALVWPTAIIIIILIFKNQIEQVILRLSRLRYKGVELEFGRDLQEVESKAKALELPPPQVIKGADEPITIAIII